MRLPLLELLLTGVLAAGFAAVGELVLHRRSRNPADGNEAMLAGMGVCAAGLFPLTLLASRYALAAEALAIGLCLAYAVADRILRRRKRFERERTAPDLRARFLFAAVLLVAAGFAALNFRHTYLWDGFLIWATKAQLLSHSGRLTREWFVGDYYDLRHLAYPNLVSLGESLLGLLRGGFDFDRLKPVFLLFYASMLVGTYAAVRATLAARFAAMAVLLVALVPTLSTTYAAGGYADMPQAAVVAGVTAAALRRRRGSLPWLIGALTTVKSEGMILAGLACGGLLLFWLLETGRGAARRVAVEWRGLAIVAVFLALRVGYVRWIDAPLDVYSGALSDALARIPRVVTLCLEQLLDFRQWGLFWPAFLLAAAALFAGGSRPAKALAAAVGAGLVVLMVPFLFTTWPLELQISQAYFRLAAQLAPAAATAAVLGYASAASRLESPC